MPATDVAKILFVSVCVCVCLCLCLCVCVCVCVCVCTTGTGMRSNSQCVSQCVIPTCVFVSLSMLSQCVDQCVCICVNHRKRAGTVVSLSVNVSCLLSVLLQPYMPATSATIQQQLNAPADVNIITPAFICRLPSGHKIGKVSTRDV